MNFLKNHLEDGVSQEEMYTVTRESNCITNVWNNLTKGSGGKGADLSNFGNEESV